MKMDYEGTLREKITLDRKNFEVLSSGLRIDILKKLDERAKTISELSREINIYKSSIHRHLRRLVESGLVEKHNDSHKWVYYCLTNKGKKKYMGVCQIGNVGRRIDIRYIDYTAYYAALIYFTGSKNFNIKIRNLALEQGYSLSEYGLKDKKTGEIICLHSERELFDLLGIVYTQPLERDI